MISVEDKINIFEQELNEQLDDFRKKALSKAQQECKSREEKADVDIKEQNQAIKDRFLRQERRNVSKIIAQGKNEARHIVLSAKKDIRADFIETLKKRIRKLIGTEEYKKYFRNNLKEVMEELKNSDSITFYINNDEYQLFKNDIDELCGNITINQMILPPKSIGGFIIHDQDGRISYDYTLENLISDNDAKLDTILNEILNGVLK